MEAVHRILCLALQLLHQLQGYRCDVVWRRDISEHLQPANHQSLPPFLFRTSRYHDTGLPAIVS